MDSYKHNDNDSEDSIENNQGDISAGKNNILSTPKERRIWFQEKLAREEDIGMPEFCIEFGYTCERDAHAAFSKLLSDSQLPLFSRTAVDQKYRTWRRNEGEGFWASRAADYRIDISTSKTVEDLVDRGQFFTSKRLRSRPQDDTRALQPDRWSILMIGEVVDEGSCPSSPEESSYSPPSPFVFNKNMDEEAQAYFNGAGSLQDVLFSSLQDGCTLPAWAKDRPLFQFKLRLQEDWGPRVTELYETAKRKAVLDHTHVDEIALLSGIVHINKRHIGFSEQELKTITANVLEMFYTQEMKEEDIRRAQDATLLWAIWVQKWKMLAMNEKIAVQRGNRDPVDSIETEPIVEAIFSSYTECKDKKITPILHIALHVFRELNSWASLVSESDCLMAVVVPILKEVMAVQHEIKFT
ncbi:hypothetical protein BGW41_007391, partial [Actinomortierella wolfii]